MIRAFLALSVMTLGVSVFAQADETTAATTPPAAISSSVTYKEAKASCLAENAALKGKDLRTCVKGKQLAAKGATVSK